MQLTAHFALEEFCLDGTMPDYCIPVYQALCEQVLEPVRAQFFAARLPGDPEPAPTVGEVVITSGYRSPAANTLAHGVAHSQHEATNIYCAADWKIVGMERNMRPVFDWIRTSGGIQFDEMILEHDVEEGTDIIHTSWSRAYNRRVALEGDTANQSAYKSWPVTPILSGII